MEEIETRRRELVKRAAAALYKFAVAYSGATWDGKRPGLLLPYPDGLSHASCGAYREWAIHVHDGTLAFSIDGYIQRADRETGAVYVATGGKFIFPPDDSRSRHSLRLSVDNGGELIPVTREESVDWEPRLAAMADKLEIAAEQVTYAVDEYDRTERERAKQEQDRRIEAAKAALAV